MIRKLKIFACIAVAVSITFVSAVGAEGKEQVNMALLTPMSGPFAALGEQIYTNLKYDVDRVNVSGGINGHQINLGVYDNRLNTNENLVQFQKALNSGFKYFVVSDTTSGATALSNAITKHNQRNPENPVVLLLGGTGDPILNNEGCSFWHFRFEVEATQKMNGLTDWIARQPEIKRIFLINQDYSWGHSISEVARDMLAEKRPDIQIVGDLFHPFAKVKDFSPYISQISASKADYVITGNYGADITLLIKSAAEQGLAAPLLTYYADSIGTVTQIGEGGVNRLYIVSQTSGDYDGMGLAKRQKELKEATGYDYVQIRTGNMLDLLNLAATKADSINPKSVAFALEDLSYDSPIGAIRMRGSDHQIQAPIRISILKDSVKYGAEATNLNFIPVDKFEAADVEMPTTCDMQRPSN